MSLREGLEALLVVIAMTIVFVPIVKTLLKYLHLGWVSARVCWRSYLGSSSYPDFHQREPAREIMEGVGAPMGRSILPIHVHSIPFLIPSFIQNPSFLNH